MTTLTITGTPTVRATASTAGLQSLEQFVPSADAAAFALLSHRNTITADTPRPEQSPAQPR